MFYSFGSKMIVLKKMCFPMSFLNINCFEINFTSVFLLFFLNRFFRNPSFEIAMSGRMGGPASGIVRGLPFG